MLDTLKKAWGIPDLRKKILFTLAMLFIFRLGANIPVPGVDKQLLVASMEKATPGGLLDFFNLMSGGAFKNLTLFALGISPYITASIVMNLLQIAIPALENLAKEGESGRRKIAQYTRYFTVILALIQGLAMSLTLFKPYLNGGALGVFVATLSLTAGTAFLMYLGEKINENGIGNGMSLFIFAGIVARGPVAFYEILLQIRSGQVNIINLFLYLIVALLIIAAVIYVTQGQRKIPVQYSKRVVGRKMYGGHSSHIPLRVNQTGVIPIIFAITILMVPMTIATFYPNSGFYQWVNTKFGQTSFLYNILYALLIVFFTYFYTAVTFNPNEIADNMKKNGGFIPGIRPGSPTESYIARSLNRLTIVGAIFLALIAIIPNLILAWTPLQLRFGGTSLLIIVGVALETMKQIEAQMVMRHYKGFLR